MSFGQTSPGFFDYTNARPLRPSSGGCGKQFIRPACRRGRAACRAPRVLPHVTDAPLRWAAGAAALKGCHTGVALMKNGRPVLIALISPTLLMAGDGFEPPTRKFSV